MIINMLSHIGRRKGNEFTVEQLLEAMQSAGVDMSVTCCQVENIDNAHTAEVARKYPEKLIGLAVVNPWALDGEEELERCFRDYGFRGVKLNAVRFGISADRHSILDPYFQLCSKYKGVVIAHAMSDLMSMPAKWEEMARNFPDVAVILSHMGIPAMVDSALKIARRTRNIYLNTAVCFAPVIKRAIEEVGPEKIVFASDTPYGSMRQEIEKIRFVTSDEGALRLILGNNAAMLLGIRPNQMPDA